MTTFVFNVFKAGSAFSGGVPNGKLYDQSTGIFTAIPVGTDVLEFTGNANGTVFADGVFGGTGNDILTGLDANDVFHGGAGADTITGGKGNDRLDGGLGANIIDGGDGNDTAQIDLSDQAGDIVAINGGAAGVTYAITVGGAAFGSLKDVEMVSSLIGGKGNDRLGGVYLLTTTDSTITAGLGTDTVVIDLSADTAGAFSGGTTINRIYNQSTGRQINLDGANIESLEFTGNATGTAAADGIFGGTGNDILIGLDGNDIFHGGTGADKISGGKGNDRLDGGLGANVIDGGEGNDTAQLDFSDQTAAVVAVNGGIAGTTYKITVGGADFGSLTNVEMVSSLKGGKGDDRLGGVYVLTSITSGIDGGGGFDTAVIDLSADTAGIFSGGPDAANSQRIYNQTTGVQLNLTGGIDALEYTGDASGTAAADGIFGGVGNDILIGLDRNDIFHGGLGNDKISGGKGNDRLDGGRGANVIDGGEGNDTAQLDFSDQVGPVVAVNGGIAGTTYKITVGGADFGSLTNVEMVSALKGGTGDDRLGGVYVLTSITSGIDGGGGFDTAVIDLSADTAGIFSGGPDAANSQRIYNQITGVQLNLTGGIDALEYTGDASGTAAADGIFGGVGNDILTGLQRNDIFHGGLGNDKISGGKGDDRLDGGRGINTIDGGEGNDTAQFDFSDQTGDVVLVNGAKAGVTYTATVGGKAFGSVKDVEILSVLTGGTGNDRLGSTYTLNGAANYSIAGGAGTDTAIIDLTGDTKGVFSGGAPQGRIYNDVTGRQIDLSLIEALEFTGNAAGSAAADGVFGGIGNDILIGLGGNDVFHGGAGADTITGADGNDRLDGGTGANTIDGGAGSDTAQFDFSDQTADVVLVNGAKAGVTYTATVGGKAFGSVKDVEILSVLTGGTGNDRLGSTYTLNGGTNYSIAGGAGTDTAVIDLSADTAGGLSGGIPQGRIYNELTGRQIDLSGIEALEFTGNATGTAAAVGVTGGTGNDKLTGLAGNDRFFGGAGNDTLRGGLGNDILDGGADDDTAVFSGDYGTFIFKVNPGVVGVTGPDGIDTLNNFEFLQFDNGLVEILPFGLGSVISISPTNVIKAEGNAGTTDFVFSLSRTGGIKLAQTVDFVVSGGIGGGTVPAAATDFPGNVFPTGTAKFAANSAVTTLTVTVAGDAAVELNERFNVTLVNPQVGAILGATTAQGVIVNDDSTLSIAQTLPGQLEGTGGLSTIMNFTVTRLGATPAGQSVKWAVTGAAGVGTEAATATDFFGNVLPSGTLVFNAGENIRVISIPVNPDSFGEANDRFAVTLSDASTGATITTAVAYTVITNDDISLSITADEDNVDEGQSGSTPVTFTVLRNGSTTGSTTVSWIVAGTGGAPANAADFAGGVLPGGALVFAPGETSKTITVNLAGDTAIEFNEDFTVTLLGPTNGAVLENTSATVTINNDDAVISLSTTLLSKPEGNGGPNVYTYSVTRSGDLSIAHSVNWAVAGAAGSGTVPAAASDFVGGVLPSGVIDFAVGQATALISIPVQTDTLGELNERFSVTLFNPSPGATLGTAVAQGIILNDDTSLAVTPATIANIEGNGVGNGYVFTVSRAGTTTGPSSVNWAVTGSGVAPANAADFAGGILPTGSLAFAAGETSKTITVSLVGDTVLEPDETFTLTLSNPVGATISAATSIGTITSDDSAISIAALSASKPEGTGGTTPYTFTLTRAGGTFFSQSVSWAVSGATGSGTLPADAADFAGGVLPSGTVTFASGESSKILTVNVAADAVGEFNERFAVTLSNPTNGALLATATAGAVIFNDDTSLTLTPASTFRNEGNTGTNAFVYTVARSGTTTGTTTVDWAFTAGGVSGTVAVAASDIVGGALPTGGTMSFAPGQTTRTITVNIAGDTAPELNESFRITLSNATPGVAIVNATASTVVLDDDTIYGTTGNDTLTGTTGADLFVIGTGLDSFTALAGTDTFRFLPSAIGPAASNSFTFEDFSRADGERFDLSRIDAVVGGTDNLFSFIGTTAFGNIAGQLRWQDNGATRLIQGDTNGDGTADLTLIVKAAGPVDANWFIL